MQDEGAGAVVGLALVGLAGLAVALVFAATREEEPLFVPEEEEPLFVPEEVEEVEEVIDAELRESYVYWAGLTAWKDVYTRWPNEWPADTDITFAWEIKNIGNVGAYFQVYAFTPGSWMYLDPGEKTQVYEEFHTPAIPVTPGYEYSRITILGRKITGERIGAVWTSEEFEIIYV
ncbi:hypothetical protein ES703_125820 [subsurface metagenome]